jgi:hypothetical protein
VPSRRIRGEGGLPTAPRDLFSQQTDHGGQGNEDAQDPRR